MLPGRSRFLRHGRSRAHKDRRCVLPHKPLDELLASSPLSTGGGFPAEQLCPGSRRLCGHSYPSPDGSGGHKPYKHTAFSPARQSDCKRFGWIKHTTMGRAEGIAGSQQGILCDHHSSAWNSSAQSLIQNPTSGNAFFSSLVSTWPWGGCSGMPGS